MRDGPPRIFDAIARTLHRARAAGGDAFLAEEAARGVADRIGAANRRFARALSIDGSAQTDAVLAPLARDWTRVAIASGDTLAVEEGAFDLAASVLALHAVDDLPGLLLQARLALKPDGLFVAALFGGETLNELRRAFAAAESEVRGGVSPRVSPFADVRDLGGLLQRAGFALPVADVERTVARYADPMRLFADLRAMGETNALVERSRRFLRRDVLAAALAQYAERFAEPDGRLSATFDIVYLTGWAPHASQQRPLKPGSAKARLADALGTTERDAGEKTGR